MITGLPFVVGTDVDGSCQQVDGSHKCLLAYVIDAKNRILAIQNEGGNGYSLYSANVVMSDHPKTRFIPRRYLPNLALLVAN